MLKKQIVKLNKAIQIRINTINDFNNNIKNINNTINNLNINNANDKNINIDKTEDNDDNIIISDDEKEEEIIKDNSSSNLEPKYEEKRYISNNRKKKNKKQNKKIKLNNNDNKIVNNNNTSMDNTIFCFENIELLGNKKIFEIIVIFNIVTIFIIFCLVGTIYSIKSDLDYDKVMEDEFMKRLAYFNLVNQLNEDEENQRNGVQGILIKNSLFESERQEIYFKDEIVKKADHNVKDVDFIFKYSSVKESKKFDIFYKRCKDNSENLIILKNNKGKKFGLVTKNIEDILKGKTPQNSNEMKNFFSLYSFSSYEILQYSFKNYVDIYTAFIQSVFKFFSNDEIPFKNKYFDMPNKKYNGQQILGTLVEIEIYQVKYIR